MRILSFQQNWINHVTGKPKLLEPEFTTYRFTRKDRPWTAGEFVRIVYRTRSKDRVELGHAVIRAVQTNPNISEFDAQQDGFECREDMMNFLSDDSRVPDKLILTWVERYTGFYEFFGGKHGKTTITTKT